MEDFQYIHCSWLHVQLRHGLPSLLNAIFDRWQSMKWFHSNRSDNIVYWARSHTSMRACTCASILASRSCTRLCEARSEGCRYIWIWYLLLCLCHVVTYTIFAEDADECEWMAGGRVQINKKEYFFFILFTESWRAGSMCLVDFAIIVITEDKWDETMHNVVSADSQNRRNKN